VDLGQRLGKLTDVAVEIARGEGAPAGQQAGDEGGTAEDGAGVVVPDRARRGDAAPREDDEHGPLALPDARIVVEAPLSVPSHDDRLALAAHSDEIDGVHARRDAAAQPPHLPDTATRQDGGAQRGEGARGGRPSEVGVGKGG
jgi:hypothetical protein